MARDAPVTLPKSVLGVATALRRFGTVRALGAFLVDGAAVGCQCADFGFGENDNGVHAYHLLSNENLEIRERAFSSISLGIMFLKSLQYGDALVAIPWATELTIGQPPPQMGAH